MSNVPEKIKKDNNEQDNKKRKIPKPLFIVIIVLACILFLFFIMAFLLFSSAGLFSTKNNIEIEQKYNFVKNGDSYSIYDKEYVYNKDVVNILIMGLKMQATEVSFDIGPQADTILLLSFNTKTHQMDILPIPRDVLAIVMVFDENNEPERFFQDYLCNGNAYAGSAPYYGGKAMEASVSDIFYGVPIHRFLSIDFDAVSVLTDFVGGVPVEAYEDYAACFGLEAGQEIVLNGEEAEVYVRERNLAGMDGTNLSRMVRQRQYFMSFANVVKNKAMKNFTFIWKLYKEAKPYYDSDLSMREIAFLGIKALKADGINMHIMEGDMLDEVTYYIDDDFLKSYIAEIMLIPVKE